MKNVNFTSNIPQSTRTIFTTQSSDSGGVHNFISSAPCPVNLLSNNVVGSFPSISLQNGTISSLSCPITNVINPTNSSSLPLSCSVPVTPALRYPNDLQMHSSSPFQNFETSRFRGAVNSSNNNNMMTTTSPRCQISLVGVENGSFTRLSSPLHLHSSNQSYNNQSNDLKRIFVPTIVGSQTQYANKNFQNPLHSDAKQMCFTSQSVVSNHGRNPSPVYQSFVGNAPSPIVSSCIQSTPLPFPSSSSNEMLMNRVQQISALPPPHRPPQNHIFNVKNISTNTKPNVYAEQVLISSGSSSNPSCNVITSSVANLQRPQVLNFSVIEGMNNSMVKSNHSSSLQHPTQLKLPIHPSTFSSSPETANFSSVAHHHGGVNSQYVGVNGQYGGVGVNNQQSSVGERLIKSPSQLTSSVHHINNPSQTTKSSPLPLPPHENANLLIPGLTDHQRRIVAQFRAAMAREAKSKADQELFIAKHKANLTSQLQLAPNQLNLLKCLAAKQQSHTTSTSPCSQVSSSNVSLPNHPTPPPLSPSSSETTTIIEKKAATHTCNMSNEKKVMWVKSQINKDQKEVLFPQSQLPFKNREDVCKRLLRYHVLQQEDDSVENSDDSYKSIFENLSEKMYEMKNHYSRLLLKQSLKCEKGSSEEVVMLSRIWDSEERVLLDKQKKDFKEREIFSIFDFETEHRKSDFPSHWFDESTCTTIKNDDTSCSTLKSVFKLKEILSLTQKNEEMETQLEEPS